ncbi:hypothetical protein COT20_02640 [bacterium (Candidatus Gribaldobacteria) CG08_land_8_20_14_0_20_39_15]|uniref:Uncharacterized protein n=1 Tax=bacterium (Candidatus Gribaldobacteria) CG08_land_8_20_14_0_20_39_15 TaxID=2014273 RepID=A0A2M6XTY3_9BACT|nr:MAG: hypothetical protein COT20_02640 [bacterium (Candidatus Gribaldobacteria) CG08_land_8_20_14_0_20_39_15]
MPKIQEKQKAIGLRKQGLSYNEILREVPVAKSTLSLWLRSVGLSQKQKQKLTEKKLASMRRGQEACRVKRIKITKEIKDEAIKEIGKLAERELWLISTTLYWAEGEKEKEIEGRIRSGRVRLSNSDPFLIKIFLKWLTEVCRVPKTDIAFRIYLHEASRYRLSEVQRHWSKMLELPIDYFQKVSWKKDKIKTKRKNTGENYFGSIDLYVRKSTTLYREIAGWIEGVCKNL